MQFQCYLPIDIIIISYGDLVLKTKESYIGKEIILSLYLPHRFKYIRYRFKVYPFSIYKESG